MSHASGACLAPETHFDTVFAASSPAFCSALHRATGAVFGSL